MSVELVQLGGESDAAPGRYDGLRSAVVNGVTAKNSKHNYAQHWTSCLAFVLIGSSRFLEHSSSRFGPPCLDRNLSASTINVKLSAVRKLITEAKRAGVVSAEEAAQMTDVPNVRQQGSRLGTG